VRVAALLIGILSAASVWAGDIDFDDPSATYQWLRIKNTQPQYQFGSGPFVCSTELAIQRIVQNATEWRAIAMKNYQFNVSWPVEYMFCQDSQKPYHEEFVPVTAVYYVENVRNPELHLLLYSNGTIMYNWEKPEEVVAAAELAGLIKDVAMNQLPFKGSVLEIVPGRGISFLKNVDQYTFQWDDIILNPDFKSGTRQVLEDFLINYDYDVFKKFGLPTARGVLLYGPPGTGKSLIAKILMSQVLREAYGKKITFFYVSARHVQSSGTVSQIYNLARLLAPSVVFIEDVDLIAGTDRNNKQEIKNELLQALNGIEPLNGVLTVATTNYADKLDPALVRSQRLGYHYELPMPHRVERGDLFRLYLRKIDTQHLDFDEISDRSEGMSGAEIRDLAQYAVEQALRTGSVVEGKVVLKSEDVRAAFQLWSETRFTKE
jgi:AAA+ superfamily predicted ATPase